MEYKHFSHQHALTLHKVQAGQQFQCHICQQPCHDSIFACWSCNFFLHEHCGNANRYVHHPAHKLHPLILMPSPTYCSGSFFCDGCGAPGSTFSYCCALCEVDLHVYCAYLPRKVSHKSHQHDVFLSFQATDKKGCPEYCDICTKKVSARHWSYVCDQPGCQFRVHTFCATSAVKPGQHLDGEPGDQTQIPASYNTSVFPPQASYLTAEEHLAEKIRMEQERKRAAQLIDAMEQETKLAVQLIEESFKLGYGLNSSSFTFKLIS